MDELEGRAAREQLLEEGSISDEVLRVGRRRLVASQGDALPDPDRGEGLAQRGVHEMPLEVGRLTSRRTGVAGDHAIGGHEPGKPSVAAALRDPLEVVTEVQRPGEVDLKGAFGCALPIEEGDDLTFSEHR